MYTPPPSSSRGGIQRHGQFHHAATASSWDSDNVFYVGMDYPNMAGACSQKPTASIHPGNYAGGCSQNKTAVPVDMASAGSAVGGYGVGTSARSSGTFAPVLPHPPRPAAPLPPASLSSMAAPAQAFTTREVFTSPPSVSCQVEGCKKVAFSVGGMSPAVLCADHLMDGMQRVAHNDRIYGKTRSEDTTPATHDSKSIKHEAETKPDTECPLAKHEPVTAAPASRNQPEIIPETKRDSQPMSGGSGVVDPSHSKLCQHPGCDKDPRYSHEQGGPPILCQSHKRAGMYTTRDGRVLVSSKDGKGVTKAVPPPAKAPSTAHSRAAAKRVQNVELESTDPDPTGLQSAMSRKLCEVPGCQVQPSYGPSGSTRPRFCCEHKGKGHVNLKNRPCLFPGCLTRPHYGLTKGRAVYCVTHKKDGMVHLLKESVVLEKECAARDIEESRREVAELKKRKAAAAAGMANSDEDDDDEEWTKESEFGRRSGRRSSSKRKSRSKARGSDRRGTGRRYKGGWNGRDSTPSPVGWSPSQEAEDKASDGSESNERCTSAFPLYSQLPDGEGVSSVMAPSVEIRLLQQARESAKAAAEASGSGRRARAPSRKLLEASGALENEGAQWMTRAIKEADAKVKKELREQRKHFKAAGLRAGEVIEAFTVAKAGGDESTADSGIEGSKIDGSSGSGSGLSNKESWRVQPQAPAKQQRGTGEGSAASANINAKKEAVEVFSPAAVDKPLERAWVMSVPDGSARERGSTMAEVDATVPIPKRSKQGPDGQNREAGRGAVSETSGNVSAGKQKTAGGGGESNGSADAGEGRGDGVDQTKCEFEDCSKTANFGVNGTVRYCKAHRLFGMHEIPQSR